MNVDFSLHEGWSVLFAVISRASGILTKNCIFFFLLRPFLFDRSEFCFCLPLDWQNFCWTSQPYSFLICIGLRSKSSIKMSDLPLCFSSLEEAGLGSPWCLDSSSLTSETFLWEHIPYLPFLDRRLTWNQLTHRHWNWKVTNTFSFLYFV